MTNMRRFINTVAFGCLLASLLAGCGNSSSTQAVPTTATIFYSHSLAFQNLTGTAMSWGYNGFGQLGPNVDPAVTTFSGIPQQVTGITGSIEAVSAGLGHILVLVNNAGTRSVWGWGFNGFGQLGGVTANIKPEDFTRTPVAIAGITGAFDPVALTVNGMSPILAIGNHSLARNSSGLWAWGNNNYGQLGVTPGTPSFRAEPATIAGF